MTRALCLFLLALFQSGLFAQSSDGNRLAYLDGPIDPYYPGTGFAKLTTPQWIGETGVTTAAILTIDDMRDPARYEAYLRPILDRLKQIDGRAPLSIFTCQVDPHDEQLQAWLQEGLSIEVHTVRHPCPLLAAGDFDAAKQTVDDCIDLLDGIPNMSPVCYRMPCCDSMNSLSPRFFAEIFNRTTPRGSFLQSDSSMFVWFNEKDTDLPAELVAGERFTKYMPRLRGWVNWIENYPYPYVIGTKCWEFPSVIPSDWEAQNRHGANNQKTVDDLKAALDACVIKEGLFTFVFHPHGWIKNTQVVELVDHAAEGHGEKVKFLNVREATERITENLLLGQPLRKPNGSDNGVRVLDLDNDGYMDVIIGNEEMRKTRLWVPRKNQWREFPFPGRLDDGSAKFCPYSGTGAATVKLAGESARWHFTAGQDGWSKMADEADGRYRDVDGDGHCDLITPDAVYLRVPRIGETSDGTTTGRWRKLGISPPPAKARLADLDGDGDLDSILSDAERFEVRLFESRETGWSVEGRSGKRGEHEAAAEIPPFTRADGSDNGAWIHGDHFYWQNEDTVTPQSQVDSRSFEFLRGRLPKKVSVLESKALDPDEALATIETSLDLKIELVAAEPEVMDPIDMAWGIDGKLWVVEMADYPLGLDGAGEPGGRVRWLRDEDGDGRYERSVLFMDGLPFPTGVMPWREGVLILAAPELIYAEDRDRDGVADHREVLYRGFGEGNQQHRANGLRWGLDNWIHIANGDSNGVIESIKTGEKVDISGRDLRIRPDTGEVEALSGRTQYGRNRDDWGNWFGCNNSIPMWHFVLPDHYLKRNPHVASPPPTVNLVRSEGRLRLFPTSLPLERFNDYDNLKRITSACGAMIYRDDVLPLGGDAFICEPVHNLILRQIVSADGYSFIGARAPEEQGREFFSSSDPWCRPVSIHTGPDGCLWVADMYRLVIEHPEWIPQEWQDRLDLRSGRERGRIYRICPKDHQARVPFDLSKLSLTEVATALGSKNGTVRDLAHQALLWDQEHTGAADARVETIERLLISPNPAGRIQALSLLDGLAALNDSHLRRALDDAHPAVRRHAIRLYEGRDDEAPFDRLAQLAIDPDAQVRLQLAFSLGEFAAPAAGEILRSLGERYGANRHFAAAVLSSAIPRLRALAGGLQNYPEPLRSGLLATIGKESSADEVAAMLAQKPDYEVAVTLLEALGPERQIDAAAIVPLVASAEVDVFEKNPPSIGAIRFLGSVGRTTGLEALLTADFSLEVQNTAVEAIADAAILLRDWERHSPAVRASIVATLNRDPLNATPILERFEGAPPGSGDSFRQFLSNHPDPAIRERATTLFALRDSTRAAVIGRYLRPGGHQASPVSGRGIFDKNCAICHALDGIGKSVGPDLAALTDRSPAALLAAILDPNRSIEDKYLTYVLELANGEARVGMISSETSTSLVLTLPDGSSETVLRSDLESIECTNRSLMPEGFEASIRPGEMHDLIAWLSQSRAQPKAFVGNEPETIAATDGGVFHLRARRAEIFGDQLVFEPQFENLGFWGSAEDHAVWTVNCERPGRYQVEIDFACHPDTAGNRFKFATLTGEIPPTGSWDDYRQRKIGEIQLTGGEQRLGMRSDGVVSGFLMDLRAVILTPLPN